MAPSQRSAVIIGASYGLGAELARELASRGYRLGLAARSADKLETLAGELGVHCTTATLDVTDPAEAVPRLEHLFDEMDGAEEIYLNAGVFNFNKHFELEPELATLEVNVVGFTAMVVTAYRHCKRRGKGTIVGISSVAGLRGGARNPAYNASKAYVSNYLEGLRARATKDKLDLRVIDVRPGFIATPMTSGFKGMFWVTPSPVAARQIVKAVAAGKQVVHVTRRWWLISWLMRLAPLSLYLRFGL